MKSAHQKRVEAFMKLAKQDVPEKPTIPDTKLAMLRASLILEEALETITALGCEVLAERTFQVSKSNVSIVSVKEPDIVEVCDGIADLSVVSIGTLSALGIGDKKLLEIVDENNMEKFAEGHSWRADGKLIKPPNFKGPTDKIKEYIDSL